MARLITIYWRGIPARVIAKTSENKVKINLSARFQEAISRAALRTGKGQSHAYIADWTRKQESCSDNIYKEAHSLVDYLERHYTDDILLSLVRGHGAPLQSIK